MSAPASLAPRTLSIALIGNPNTGKSTLFNALCGARQRVGNYAGVTVEKKIGRTVVDGRAFTVIDLPGTYSLAPRSPDEMVAVEVLLGRRNEPPPDVVLCIVDASNLERNLYVVSQVLELGLPTVIALNMVNLARDKGLALDIARLRQQLPAPVVEVQANRGRGVAELKRALAEAAEGQPAPVPSPFPAPFVDEVARLHEQAKQNGNAKLPRYLVERLLLDTSGYLAAALPEAAAPLVAEVQSARQRLAAAGLPVPGVEAMSRYRWAAETLAGVVARPAQRQATFSDRVDRLLTHRVWGTLVFALVMLALFQAVFYMAEPASFAIDALNGWLSGLVEANLAEGALRSLLTKGVIDGVGGVLVFLPQIFTLFLFIAVLEDCGYMARAAYLMDKLMVRVGLSGKSFIPLLSSFACAIPGIMAARVIEHRRDRLMTILLAPLMSCSARLPVYQLLILTFIPDTRYAYGLIGLRGLVLAAMYFLGIAVAVAVAWVLKKTLFRGAAPPLVMELPSYKWPGAGVVLHRMLEQGWQFVQRAGTLILAVSILVWAAAYYPHDPALLDPALVARQTELQARVAALAPADPAAEPPPELASAAAELQDVNNRIAGGYLATSYLGRVGRLIEPAVRPMGWDWKLGCAAIASFPAREVVVATLGVIYNLGEEEDESSETLHAALRNATWSGTDRPVFTIPTALSVMVFFALCAQCASTLAVMRRETGGWGWPAFSFAYMTGLAYVAAVATFQIGSWLLGQPMPFDWQNAIAVGLALLAAAYVARRAWRRLAGPKQAGCGGGCSSCPGGTAGAAQPRLTSLEMTPSARGPSR